MNLYNLHAAPEQLSQYNQRLSVPIIALEELENEINNSEHAMNRMQRIRTATKYKDVLIKDARTAYLLATQVLDSRVYDAEDIIKQDELWWDRYTYYFGMDNE